MTALLHHFDSSIAIMKWPFDYPHVVEDDVFEESLLESVIDISIKSGRILNIAILFSDDDLKNAIKIRVFKKEVNDLCENIFSRVAGVLSMIECSISECMLSNIGKLKKRYPEGYTDQAARDRADKNESTHS